MNQRAGGFARNCRVLTRAIPEGQAVLAYGGQAVAIDFEHDRSTTKLLNRVRAS